MCTYFAILQGNAHFNLTFHDYFAISHVKIDVLSVIFRVSVAVIDKINIPFA